MAIKYLDAKRIRGSSTDTVISTGDTTTVSSLTDVVFDDATKIGTVTYSGNEITLSASTSHVDSINANLQFQNSGTQIVECDAENTGNSAWITFGLASAKVTDSGSDHGAQLEYGIRKADDGRTYIMTSSGGWSSSLGNFHDNSKLRITNNRTSVTYEISENGGSWTQLGSSTTHGTPAAAYYLQATVSQTGTAGSYTFDYTGDVKITTTTVTDEKATLVAASPNCATFAGGYAGTMGSLMSGTGDWSVSIWGYATGGTSGNFGLFSSNGSAELMYYQGAEQRIKASSGGTAIGSTDDSEDIAQSTWFHAVYTRESGTGKLYLQGELVATGTDTTDMPSGTEWRVGHANSGEEWTGSQIEFAVWNGRALTLAEVQSIYNSGDGKKIPDATLNVSGASYTEDLTGYYPMDTDFDKFAGTGGTNGVISGSATVDNSSPATPIPASSNLPENTLFEETDTYKIYGLSSNQWQQWYPLPWTYGITFGGTGNQDLMNKVTIATTGNASNIGNMVTDFSGRGYGTSDRTRALIQGACSQAQIDYTTIATASTTADFGDLSVARGGGGAVSDMTKAAFGGGDGNCGGQYKNEIDYVTVQTTGNAADFGDLAHHKAYVAGASDFFGTSGKGWFYEIGTSSNSDAINVITIGTPASATSYGSLYQTGAGASANESDSRVVAKTNGYSNDIQYFSIPTYGTAATFGDVTVARAYATGGFTNKTRAVFHGGNLPSAAGRSDVMDYVTIATTGNATDFGDLSEGVYDMASASGT